MLADASSLNLRDAFNTPPPPLDFVAAGLKAGTVGILASPGGVGKSFLSIELAMGVAAPVADGHLLNLGIRSHGRVLMLNAEDPLDVLHERVHAIGQFLDDSSREAVQEQLKMTSLRGKRPNLLDSKWVDAISTACEGARLLVVDTFSRFHTGDENSNAEMAEAVGGLEVIAERSGAAVLALHHTSKAATLNGQQASQQSTRGASAIVDNARWQSYLEAMSEKDAKDLSVPIDLRRHFVSFGVSKQNYGRPLSPRWLVRLDKGVLVDVRAGGDMLDAVKYLRELIDREAGVDEHKQPVYVPALGSAVESPSGVW
jgi:regulatory protein RepA